MIEEQWPWWKVLMLAAAGVLGLLVCFGAFLLWLSAQLTDRCERRGRR
jgi:hypothetical protein